ncbi:hypothetical protein BDA96_01G319000 [Sorghum bicolor]|uniref:Uncharacterized protein n=1 Tax=Sorghum bicolor TaxID=4558 RepID=A0A921S2L2_SORBI|nr:hypothetical protein BDA96_01G319000 [Sorghum bicolor]
MASDSASSSTPPLLSGFTAATAAGFVREALGMVKRSPLPAPPLEMSPCRLLLRTPSSEEEGDDTGDGGDPGGAGPLVLILTMALGLGSGTPPPARSWRSGKNGHLGPLDRPAERDRSARYRFRSFSILWRHCTPDLCVAVGNRPQRAVTVLATSSQSAARRLPFRSRSHLSRYASMSARVSSCVQHGGGSLRPEPPPPSPKPPPEEAAAAAAAAAAATGAARGGRSGDETTSSLAASEDEEDMAGQLRRRRLGFGGGGGDAERRRRWGTGHKRRRRRRRRCGAVVGRGRGPRPRGEMTGWGGHRPPLRPRGRAERCGGFAGFVAESRTRGARRMDEGRKGRGARWNGTRPREYGAASGGRSPCQWRARAPASAAPQPRGVAVCRVGSRDGWWMGGWRLAGGGRPAFFPLGSARPRPDLFFFPRSSPAGGMSVRVIA